MAVHLIYPFQVAVIIQYSLILRAQDHNQEPRSLASFFFKSIELKIKAQYLLNHNLIQDDETISEFDKSLIVEVMQNDFFDVDLFRSNNFDFLARLLCTANYQSLKDRYGNEYVEDMNLELLTQIIIDNKQKAYKYAKELSYLSFIKLLDHLHYHCYEMQGYKTSLCKSFIDLVNYHIIRIQPEYMSSPWDLNEAS